MDDHYGRIPSFGRWFIMFAFVTLSIIQKIVPNQLVHGKFLKKIGNVGRLGTNKLNSLGTIHFGGLRI
jgi:hypothetical protein